jgi:hypothetical protein
MNTIVAEERAVNMCDGLTPLQRALLRLCEAVEDFVNSNLYAGLKMLVLVNTASDELFELLSPVGEDGKRVSPEKHPELALLRKRFHIGMVMVRDLIDEHKRICKQRKEPTDPILTSLECRLRLVDSSLWI